MKKTKLIITENQLNNVKKQLTESYQFEDIVSVVNELPENVTINVPIKSNGMSIQTKDKNKAIEQMRSVVENDPKGGIFRIWSIQLPFHILNDMSHQDRKRLSDLKRSFDIDYAQLKPYLPYIESINITYDSDFRSELNRQRSKNIDAERAKTGSGGMYIDD